MTELNRGDDRGVDAATADFERAMALYRSGHAAEAETVCRATLDRHPDHGRILQLLGLIRFAAGDTASAIDVLTRVVSLKPDDATAEFNLGAALGAVGRLEEAALHYRRAIELRPGLTEAHTSLGAVLQKLEQLAEAEAALHQALALSPDDPLALANLASVLFDQGRLDEAIETARRAAERAPDLMPAQLQLGRALVAHGDVASGALHLQRARDLAPDSPQPGYLLTRALHEVRALDEAEAIGAKTVARFPDDADAACNLAGVKLAQGEIDAAVELYRRAVRLSPKTPLFHRGLLSALLYSSRVTSAERFAAHVAFGRAMAARAGQALPLPGRRPYPGRKLRIGWLSSDFRNHPVTVNLGLAFTCRDRSRFEYVAYADVLNPDQITDVVRSDMDGWRSIVGWSDHKVAAAIRADEIDVMIYLAGRFDGNRPQIAAWRPAPVQVSFHDPATSGLAEMDYLIADPVLVPRGASEAFTERVIRLPSFFSHPRIETVGSPGPTPVLAAGRATFGSFNNPAKLGEQVLALWAELLRRVPGSRILFKYRQLYANPKLQDRIRRGLGDAATQADFAAEPDVLVEDHLRAYDRIDVALDTFPFTGSTTTFEALWMGVPVVTLLGDTMVGRWSASILHTLKLDRLIARRPEDYLDVASGLAADPAYLAALRTGLRDRIRQSPICNGPLRARQLERVLCAVWCYRPAAGLEGYSD